MHITRDMIRAAQRAEFDQCQAAGELGQKFVPTPDDIIRLMLQAALGNDPKPNRKATAQPLKVGRIVTAQPPRKRRR